MYTRRIDQSPAPNSRCHRDQGGRPCRSADAADGAIVLMEKTWPALAHVDSSSGALGNAVNKTVQELVDIVVAACGGPATRASASLPRRLFPAEPR